MNNEQAEEIISLLKEILKELKGLGSDLNDLRGDTASIRRGVGNG